MTTRGPKIFKPPTATDLFAPLSARLNLATLEIHVSPLWGAASSDHRTHLHQALEARIKDLGCVITSRSPYPVSAPARLAIASKDIARSISISVSHARGIGGFALLSSHEGTIGFDIEETGRVSDVIAKRVCAKNEELTMLPDLFWAAKEASFKALRGPSQPAVLSDLRLGHVETLASSRHFFDIRNPEQIHGLGLALQEKTHALSLFVLAPST